MCTHIEELHRLRKQYEKRERVAAAMAEDTRPAHRARSVEALSQAHARVEAIACAIAMLETSEELRMEAAQVTANARA